MSFVVPGAPLVDSWEPTTFRECQAWNNDTMRTMTKLTVALSIVLGASIPAAGIASQADATPGTVKTQQAAATITISDMKNDPADATTAVGQPVTVTNNDPMPHTVTAADGSFNVEVPANGTVNLTV